MQLGKEDMVELAELVASAVVKSLVDNNLVNRPLDNLGNAPHKSEKTAYQKTEQLLYNYNGFKRIVEERQREAEDIRKFGVPGKSGSIVQYSPHCGTVSGIVLPEESVEDRVRTVLDSVQGTVQVIALIDKAMYALRNDPYYKILEMYYFDGRTLEDIAYSFGCSQPAMTKNKARLVRELSLRIFPDQTIKEFMN